MVGQSMSLQTRQGIIARIIQGEWSVGTQLPGEPALAEIFHVSRGTIRNVLDELAKDGIISRRSGLGTFVIRVPVDKPGRLLSMTEQVRARDQRPVTKVISAEQVHATQADGRVWEAFGLNAKTAAEPFFYKIVRLRLADRRPIALQTVYLPVHDFGQELLKRDLSKSLYVLYDEHHRLPAWADEQLSARPAHIRATSRSSHRAKADETPMSDERWRQEAAQLVDDPETVEAVARLLCGERPADEVRLFGMQKLEAERRFIFERSRISYDSHNLVVEVMTSIDSQYFGCYRYRIAEEDLGRGATVAGCGSD